MHDAAVRTKGRGTATTPDRPCGTHWFVRLLALCFALAGTNPLPVRAQPTPNLPRVVILSTAPRSGRTDVIIQDIGARAPAQPVASFEHLPDAVVKGALIPNSDRVTAIAATDAHNDSSWSASLLLVQPGAPAKQLASDVYEGTRPIVLGNKVYVLRGEPGPEATEAEAAQGRLRVDTLHLDEIDSVSTRRRRVVSLRGYIALIAGALGAELIVYHVGPEGAALRAVEIGTGKLRVLAEPIAPFARAFSIDEEQQALLYSNRDPSGVWQVERIELSRPRAPGPFVPARTTLERSKGGSISAHAWPKRGVVFSEGSAGLRAPSGARAARPTQQLGTGSDELRDFFATDQQTWAVGVHRVKGQFPVAFAVSEEGTNLVEIVAPREAQLDVVGVLPERPRGAAPAPRPRTPRNQEAPR